MPLSKMKDMQWQMHIIFFILLVKYSNGFVGMNWGKGPAENGHISSVIVDLFLRHEFKDARIFSNGVNITNAFERANITMSFTFRNHEFNHVQNVEDAKTWLFPITKNCTTSQITIRYIMVSDDPFANGKPLNEEVVDKLRFLSEGIVQGGDQTQARATIPHSTDVLKNVSKPSEGEFKDELKDIMNKTLSILTQYQAPFVLEIMPLQLVHQMNNDISFALCNDTEGKHAIKDTNNIYTNVFDFWYDTCFHALRKLGAPEDLEIVVGRVGWPADGSPDATPENAAIFYKNFLKKIVEGTPMHPRPVDLFFETLIDESMLRVSVNKQNMGIYRFDGIPKYHVDFTGKSSNIEAPPLLPPVMGITPMPDRYCILKGKITDTGVAKTWYDKACDYGNCSPLDKGGSCSILNEEGKLSYAFNLLYQLSGQLNCSFDGLGMVVNRDQNPTIGNCTFPVAILGPNQLTGSK